MTQLIMRHSESGAQSSESAAAALLEALSPSWHQERDPFGSDLSFLDEKREKMLCSYVFICKKGLNQSDFMQSQAWIRQCNHDIIAQIWTRAAWP